MKKMILTTAIVVAGLMMISTMAVAQQGNWDRGFGPKMSARGGHGPNGHGPNGYGHFGDGQMGQGMHSDRMGHLLRMADELELTEDQIDKIKTLKTDFQLQMVDVRAEMQKAKIQLRSLRQDTDVSESTVFSAIDDLSKKQAEMRKMQYSHHQEMRSVLTPEQQEKAKELRFERGQRGMNRDGDGDGYGKRQNGRRGR